MITSILCCCGYRFTCDVVAGLKNTCPTCACEFNPAKEQITETAADYGNGRRWVEDQESLPSGFCGLPEYDTLMTNNAEAMAKAAQRTSDAAKRSLTGTTRPSLTSFDRELLSFALAAMRDDRHRCGTDFKHDARYGQAEDLFKRLLGDAYTRGY